LPRTISEKTTCEKRKKKDNTYTHRKGNVKVPRSSSAEEPKKKGKVPESPSTESRTQKKSRQHLKGKMLRLGIIGEKKEEGRGETNTKADTDGNRGKVQ